MSTPILILGYERSGTTLLRRLVSMHPSLLYEVVHERKNLLFKARDQNHAIKLMTYPATQAGKKTGSIMSVRAGQKIPYTTFRECKKIISKFSDLFPDRRIIHIVRDPEGCISSQVRTFRKNADDCIKRYFESVPSVLDHLKNISPVYYVDYESLINQPHNTVRAIYDWIEPGVSDSHITNVISRKDPWQDIRVMCGLRYFSSIQPQTKQSVLDKSARALIKSQRRLFSRSPPTRGGDCSI